MLVCQSYKPVAKTLREVVGNWLNRLVERSKRPVRKRKRTVLSENVELVCDTSLGWERVAANPHTFGIDRSPNNSVVRDGCCNLCWIIRCGKNRGFVNCERI